MSWMQEAREEIARDKRLHRWLNPVMLLLSIGAVYAFVQLAAK